MLMVYPSPILRTNCDIVDIDNADWRDIQFIKDRLETTLTDMNALGIAANQINHAVRMISLRVGGKIVTMINPVLSISEYAEKKVMCKEGCLSFPNMYVHKERYDKVTVFYTNIDKERDSLTLDGIEAVCAQHEIDHLNGTVFLDGMSKFQLVRAIDYARKRGSNYSLLQLKKDIQLSK